jgi:uncharacterized protein (UPF0212 family)
MNQYITRGEVTTLTLTAQNDETAESIAGATLTTRLPDKNGQYVEVANGSHTIIESGANDTGEFTVALSAAVTARLPLGKDINFSTKVVIGGNPKYYWGVLPEVREP